MSKSPQTKQRSIFEDVSETPKPVTKRKKPENTGRAARVWLVILMLLVVLMIAVGGLTRLTDSGLSITEWKPITGAIPPMNEAAWQAEFEKYQQIPEFTLQNSSMDLAAFKGIYYWEWGHRLLGRVIGLVWFVGFLGLYFTQNIRRDLVRPLFLIGVLIGLQGLMGWIMVASGLGGDRVDVRAERLAAHLGLAFVILGMIYWNLKKLSRSAADIMQARRQRIQLWLRRAQILVGLVFIQILFGALVAGVDGGTVYNDWPLMGGSLIPSGDLVGNWLENPAFTQFMHRIIAYVLFGYAIFLAFRARQHPYTRAARLYRADAMIITLQAVVGIVTLIYIAPLPLAFAHQLLAIGVFLMALQTLFIEEYPEAQKITV